MRKWKCHKIVEAEVITALNAVSMERYLQTGSGVHEERHEVPESFWNRGAPEIGDYLVRYEDGYMSWSPKKAFEDGYSEISGG